MIKSSFTYLGDGTQLAIFSDLLQKNGGTDSRSSTKMVVDLSSVSVFSPKTNGEKRGKIDTEIGKVPVFFQQ